MTNINDLLQEAITHYQQNDLVTAGKVFLSIIDKDSGHFESLFFLGVINSNRRDYDDAIKFFEKALLVRPCHAETYNNIGVAFLEQCKFNKALECFRQAIKIHPDFEDYHLNIGIVFQKQGNLSEAEWSYNQALKIKPDYDTVHYNLGVVFYEQGRLAEAINCFKNAIKHNPDYFSAYNSLGDALQKQGKLDEAVVSYSRAIELKPNYADAFYNLGLALKRQCKFDAAVESFRHAINLKPDCFEFHYHLGNVLKEKGDYNDAIESYKNAIKYNPNSAEAYLNLGVSFIKLERLNEAIVSCSQAIKIKPDYAEAFYNLGVVFCEQGKPDDAINSFKKAIDIKPNYKDAYLNMGNAYKSLLKIDEAINCFTLAISENVGYDPARMNRALTWLLKGDYKQGWHEYEYRLRKEEYPRREFPYPRWDGSHLNGRTILVHCEQGFGDTIQFVRLLPLVKERGGHVVFECRRNLVGLLKNCAGIDKIIEMQDKGNPPRQASPATPQEGNPLVRFDVYIQLLSLAGIFGITLDNLPDKTPYIFPDPEHVSVWKDKLGHGNSFKVGIVWAGNPKQGNDRNRSCSLAHFAPLGDIPGLTLFSLQKGEPSAQIDNTPNGLSIIDLNKGVGDFLETAAVISNLDLVISVDTSVAHLAGAIGKSVWTLVCFCPSWHLQLKGDECPWYPSMRLFRQPKPGDWDSVINRVVELLVKIVKNYQSS